MVQPLGLVSPESTTLEVIEDTRVPQDIEEAPEVEDMEEEEVEAPPDL